MSTIDDLRKIKAESFAVYCIVFLSIIAPGMLMLYLYKPHMFETVGAIKLIIFSIALSLPLPTLNTFISGMIDRGANEESLQTHVLMNLISCFVCLYASILIAYLLTLSFKQFLIVLAAFEMAYVLCLLHLEFSDND